MPAPAMNVPDDSAGQPLEPIGAGITRDCYAWPGRDDLCIKVPKTARGTKQTAREPRYLRRLARRYPDTPLDRLPRFHGLVTTTAGTGWIIDRVVDHDGAVSPRLQEALAGNSRADAMRFAPALDDFKRWMAATPAVLRDLSPTNFCVRTLAEGRFEFVPIDGLCPGSALHRWWPTHVYARRGKAEQIERGGFESIDTLLARADRIADTYANRIDEPVPRAAWLVGDPVPPVRGAA